jgi:hypothetical protein
MDRIQVVEKPAPARAGVPLMNRSITAVTSRMPADQLILAATIAHPARRA